MWGLIPVPADPLDPALAGSNVSETPAVRHGPLSPVITPTPRRLRGLTQALFGLLAVNFLYLLSVSLAEGVSGAIY